MSDPKIKECVSDKSSCQADKARRLVIASTIGVSTACALFPFAAGLTSILDPVLRSSGTKKNIPWTKVTPIVNLPDDGKPAKYEIILARSQGCLDNLQKCPCRCGLSQSKW